MKITLQYTLTFLVIILTGMTNCAPNGSKSNPYISVSGQTMGTTYHIKFNDMPNYLNYQYDIDSVLTDVNNALSHYIPTSVISNFNLADSVFRLEKGPGETRSELLNDYFVQNYQAAYSIWKLTAGAFDPTVGPIVNFWGFGSDGRKEVGMVDTNEVEKILEFVGFHQIRFTETMAAYVFEKSKPEIKLDFSALAKGFGIDKVSEFLEAKGAEHYMVEIGGEVRSKGVNQSAKKWKIGVSKPDAQALQNEFFATLNLDNEAMASSGNYRNYYIKDGIKRFHSINPVTGFPEENNLRSATIIAEDCMTADALATACMILGKEKATSMLYTIDGIEAFLIYEKEDGNFGYFATTGVDFQLIH
jgi:thiamine biosynthesis lipoprotein